MASLRCCQIDCRSAFSQVKSSDLNRNPPELAKKNPKGRVHLDSLRWPSENCIGLKFKGFGFIPHYTTENKQWICVIGYVCVQVLISFILKFVILWAPRVILSHDSLASCVMYSMVHCLVRWISVLYCHWFILLITLLLWLSIGEFCLVC